MESNEHFEVMFVESAINRHITSCIKRGPRDYSTALEDLDRCLDEAYEYLQEYA